MDNHIEGGLVSYPVIPDDYLHNVRLSYHLRIHPYKFLEANQSIDIIKNILESASTMEYPILYCVEKEEVSLNSTHFHILLTKPQFKIVKAEITKLKAKGNGASSKTVVRDALKVVKYILKDGNYWDHHHNAAIREWFVQLTACTFRKNNEYKSELIIIEDQFLMDKISFRRFKVNFIKLQVDFNRSSAINLFTLNRYFRFVELRRLKRTKNNELYEQAICRLLEINI